MHIEEGENVLNGPCLLKIVTQVKDNGTNYWVLQIMQILFEKSFQSCKIESKIEYMKNRKSSSEQEFSIEKKLYQHKSKYVLSRQNIPHLNFR